MSFSYPMGTYDALFEVIRYMQERHDPDIWRYWWAEHEALANGIEDTVEKLHVLGEARYIGDMRLGRATMILNAEIFYMQRDEWLGMVRRVWELLCDADKHWKWQPRQIVHPASEAELEAAP